MTDQSNTDDNSITDRRAKFREEHENFLRTIETSRALPQQRSSIAGAGGHTWIYYRQQKAQEEIRAAKIAKERDALLAKEAVQKDLNTRKSALEESRNKKTAKRQKKKDKKKTKKGDTKRRTESGTAVNSYADSDTEDDSDEEDGSEEEKPEASPDLKDSN